MVQRVRLRGHVIRLYGISPSTSWALPQTCPTCGTTYNDGTRRKCVYLCCGYEDCFDCVLSENLFYCSNLKPNTDEQAETTTAETEQTSSNTDITTLQPKSTSIEWSETNYRNEPNYRNNNKTEDRKNIPTFDDLEQVMDVEENQIKLENIKPEIDEKSMSTLKSQIEFFIPKYQLNPVVWVKQESGVSTPRPRRCGRPKGKVIKNLRIEPSRRSGRLGNATCK